ncbi:MAG TPA: hypothetical protein VHE59_16920 [Mucilaginibacter sp.]|nr:hypothetical protein [Mucilaginibacter sp.]
MTLSEYCATLSQEKLLETAIACCEVALTIWDEYALANKLSYRDTVVGMHHEVRPELLHDSLLYCTGKSSKDFATLLDEFSDPKVAIQDSDWELPSNVEKVFHAFYNLLDGLKKPITVFDEQTHYVAINQAIDAIYSSGKMTVDQIKSIIYDQDKQ